MTTLSPTRFYQQNDQNSVSEKTISKYYDRKMKEIEETRKEKRRMRKGLLTLRSDSYCGSQEMDIQHRTLAYPVDKAQKIQAARGRFMKNNINLHPMFRKSRKSLGIIKKNNELAANNSTQKLIRLIKKIKETRVKKGQNDSFSPTRQKSELAITDQSNLAEEFTPKSPNLKPALKNCLTNKERAERLQELKKRRQDRRKISSFPFKQRVMNRNDCNHKGNFLLNSAQRLPGFSQTIYNRKESEGNLIHSEDTLLNGQKNGKINIEAQAAGLKKPRNQYGIVVTEEREMIPPPEFYKNRKKQGRYNDAHIKETWGELFPYKGLWEGKDVAEQLKKYSLKRHGILSNSLDRKHLQKPNNFLRKSDHIFKLVDFQKHSILRDLEIGHFKV
ncbi:unnamed protein product [Moneuplotes crassus]|uniref:Uncharacterized protein n=1 Tax=Euplotes crassus TaxID=5936 RepID=A0AAD1XCD1_EUPCR|nr:unnamed protein product [Moneuplotes crassus]